MFYKFFSYLRFLSKSTNQHGVHSPFVYNFVTKGLYNKQTTNIILKEFKTLNKKEQKVISKIVSYFKPEKIFFEVDDSNESASCNFIYIKINEVNNSFLKHENSKNVFIFYGIHNHKTSFLKWDKIIQHKKATVTIDLFWFGLVFFRKEQEKEHFTIRA